MLPLVLLSVAFAGPVPFQPSNPLPPPSNPPIQQIEPGVFELGKVRLNKKNRTVHFTGTVNMKEGLIEYLLVHGSGKIHESLFRTEVEPYHVHLAILLLSDKKNGARTDSPGATAPAPASPEPQNVRIWIEWQQGDSRQRVPAENFILDVATKKTMSQGPWTYIGSRVMDGMFLAQRDGSMIAVIDDPDALVNNRRPGAANDENWQIRATNLPDVGVPVTISLELKNAASK